MSRSRSRNTDPRRTTGCHKGRNCAVCHPGKPEPPARDRRRLQDDGSSYLTQLQPVLTSSKDGIHNFITKP